MKRAVRSRRKVYGQLLEHARRQPHRECCGILAGQDGLITQVTPVRDLRQWENGGYFVIRPEIFDHLNEGEDLVEDALVRMVPLGRVLAYPFKGYWSPADTVKERAQLEEMYHQGNCPWMIWDPERSGVTRETVPAASVTATV